MKKLLFIIIFLLCFKSTFAAMKLPSPTPEFFVNDFANVISAEDEEKILKKTEGLYAATGNSTQVVVATINSLEGYGIEEYANNLFREWGIGNKDKNDGILILLAVNDRKSRIEVGYGLEGTLPDGKTGGIQDTYMIPYFKENNFSKGLAEGAMAVCDIISGEMSIDDIKAKEDEDISDILMGIIVYMIILFLFFKVATKSQGFGGLSNYNNNGGSSYRRGGSSSHSSGSGSSHHSSGGGGSSGGGRK